MTINQRLMTADELFRLPDDGLRHELIRGVLRTMAPTGWEHGEHTSVLDASLGAYVRDASRTLDRKSTRLNSSHRTNSYAVFCLKKKKKDAGERREIEVDAPL